MKKWILKDIKMLLMKSNLVKTYEEDIEKEVAMKKDIQEIIKHGRIENLKKNS